MKGNFIVCFFLALLFVLPACGGPVVGRESRAKSPGERIYYTGVGVDGKPIPIEGGPSWLKGQVGCVACHGAEGKGGLPLAGGTVVPSDIRYKALVGEVKHTHAGREVEHHYTDELIKRAITRGLGADGEKLDQTMPRWKMSEADLKAVIAYLKTLK